MITTVVCTGVVTAGADRPNSLPACDTRWEIIPYVEPTDSTAIYAQLVALNEFDPIKIAGIITFCLVMFIVGFGIGLVIRNMRRL